MSSKLHTVRRKIGIVGRVSAPLVLRLATGHWPDADSRAAFLQGVSDERVNMPPLFRGLAAIKGTNPILQRAVSYSWHDERGTLDPTGPPDLGGNLFTAWTGPPVSFLHFEKCGGIALLRWLSAQFHPLQIRPAPYRSLPPHLFSRLPPADPTRHDLVWGHYDLPTLRRIGGPRLTFTLLRNPRDRILSLYRFWRSVKPERIDQDISFAVGAAHRLPLAAFLATEEPMLRDLIDNVFVRRLTGLYATGASVDPLRENPAAALGAATAALDRLDHVVVTEHLADSMAGLATRLGLPAPPALVAANVTSQNHTDPSGWFRAANAADITGEAETALNRLTSLDRQLYARAVRRSKT